MLLVEQVDFVAQLVSGVLKPVHLLLELITLGAYPRQLFALRVHASFCVRLRPNNRRKPNQSGHQQSGQPQTRRRCLPTDTRLPTTPIIAPPITPRNISWRSKKIVSMKYSLTMRLVM